ncbi:unnamed protein product [Candidula unifasciata]|uniref:Proline-rich transmembrane protein 3/4 domain-containing protein n=1 Tax=Candidula unifasciata TaxID=100452 RepID=A0A8S3Z7R7_9EUPU|nr:unnamed protein product [Candidula unifasciata]
MSTSSIANNNGAVSPTLPAAVARLDWEAAKQTWAYAWEIHIYVFGGLFGLIGLYTLLSLARCWWIRCLLPSGYLIWLHILLMVVCFTRSFYLLYDGYGSRGSFHESLNHFLYSVTFPCLTAAFSSLFYWFLQTTQVRLMPPFVQKLQVLVVVIAVHFMISLTTDVLVGIYPGMHIMQFVCHAYYITWSLFLFLCYACIFRKLHLHAVKYQKDESYNPAIAPPYSAEKSSSLTVNTAVKVMLCVAVCGLVVTGLEIYAILEVYKLFTPGLPGIWTWWSCHTALRIFELCMCFLLIYVISLPRRYRRSGASCSCGILCAPCSEICCCRPSINKPKRGSFFKHFHKTPVMNSFHKIYKESFTENSSKELLENQLTDDHPVQPIFGSRPNSLLIIEDGYVRFQTEYDINKIVDSCNDLSQRPVETHSMGTFLGTDGVLNTGYTLNPGEDSQTRNNSDTQAFITNKSRNSSAANSDYFRVPSSVSLADSIENELEKAFRSFKMDTSVDDEETNQPTQINVVSEVENVEIADQVSVVSLPNSSITANSSLQKAFQRDLDNEQVLQTKSQYQIMTGQHQLLTLPSSNEFTESKRTANTDGSLSDPKISTQGRKFMLGPHPLIRHRQLASSVGWHSETPPGRQFR